MRGLTIKELYLIKGVIMVLFIHTAFNSDTVYLTAFYAIALITWWIGFLPPKLYTNIKRWFHERH